MFWTIWWRHEGQFANFLATTPFTLQRCLAELMDIFRCGFFCSNPKMLLQVIGYFDFPKLSSKTCESELLFARDSKVSKILKWRTFYAPLKEPSSLEQHSRGMVDFMIMGSFLWLARITWPPQRIFSVHKYSISTNTSTPISNYEKTCIFRNLQNFHIFQKIRNLFPIQNRNVLYYIPI